MCEPARTEGPDAAALARLADRFVRRTLADLDAARSAAAAGDVETLRRLAHRLRGTAETYGIESIASAARALGDVVREGGEAGPLVTAVEKIGAQARLLVTPSGHQDDVVPVPVEGPRVLCIEDDPDIALLLRATLSQARARVAVVPDGADGWEVLMNDERPAIVLLDLSLPGLDGEELLRRRARHEELARIPVIVLSARPTARDVVEHHANTKLLLKPFSPQELLDVMREAEVLA